MTLWLQVLSNTVWRSSNDRIRLEDRLTCASLQRGKEVKQNVITIMA